MIELFPAGRQIALPSPDVDLTFAGFPLLLGDLAILRREVLRELLHALRRSFELFALVIEAGVVGLVRFRLFGELGALLGEFRLPALEFGQAPRERFLPFLDDPFALRYSRQVIPQLLLPVPDGLVLAREEALAAFGFPQALVERLPGLRDLLGLGLQVRVEIVHLLPLAFEGSGPRIERCLAVAVGGFFGGQLPFQAPELGLPFGEAALLGLELRPSLLGLHREDLLLRLDLDVPGRPSLLQPVQDQPAGLLDCLQFGPEGVEFALSHRAPLILLFEFPFPAVELLFALDERSFLTATGFELFLVDLALAGLLGDRLVQHLVRVADAFNGGLGVAPLEMVDADRRVSIVVRAHFELGPGTRRVLQDLGQGFVARHVGRGPVFRQDPIPAPQDEDPLGRRVAPKDGRLEDPVEFHRPKLRED